MASFGLSARVEILWLPDGDHSFKPRVRSGVTLRENLEACVDAVARFVLAVRSA